MSCSRPLHQREENVGWPNKRVDIWEMGVSVSHILPRSGPGPGPGSRVQGPGSPLKSDAWNWTITSAGGCWLGTCSPALLLRPASEDKTNIFWWGRDNCGTLACGIPQKVWKKVLVMSQKCRMNTQHMILKWKRCIVYCQAEDKLPCFYLSAISWLLKMCNADALGPNGSKFPS